MTRWKASLANGVTAYAYADTREEARDKICSFYRARTAMNGWDDTAFVQSIFECPLGSEVQPEIIDIRKAPGT